MRIVFFGCDDFAAVHLQRLIDDGHFLAGLVTQPDKPKGRGMHIVPSPTKKIALPHSIHVFQPENLKDPVFLLQLKACQADIFVVVAYGKLLTDEVLNIPAYGCVNVHPSLLPKYRGAAPVNWAVINGDTVTGVTLIRMNASMDGGDILTQEECPLSEIMTSVELRALLMVQGAKMLSALLPRFEAGNITALKQDETLASRAPKLNKELGLINWNMPAKKIHDLVRGTQPWPGAYTFYKGGLLKVLEAQPVAANLLSTGSPGQIVEVRKDGFYVQAEDQAVWIKRVHPAGGKSMDARSFCAGHKVFSGERMGFFSGGANVSVDSH